MMKSETSNCVNSSSNSSRFTNLPDDLISHILSFLPTKEAVATSVLSSRWKFLWTFITNIDFKFDCCSTKKPKLKGGKITWQNFISSVNRVLLILNQPSIQKFRLATCCATYIDLSSLKTLIPVDFRLTIREFTLYLDSGNADFFILRQIDFNVAVLKLIGSRILFDIRAATSLCNLSLQTLHLTDIACEIHSTSSLRFSNLKIMRLTRVLFLGEDSTYKLLSSSPVLDELVIENVSSYSKGCLIIQIPSLTRLSIKFSGIQRVEKVKIDCLALQYLNVRDEFPCEYLLVENLSCLVQANVQIFSSKYEYDLDVERCNNIITFVQSLSNVEFLSVSNGVLKALKIALANITLGFHNLTRLEIVLFNCVDLCVMINKFLERMDNLKHLIIKECRGNRYFLCHRPRWAEPLNVPKSLPWAEPSNVPKCLLLRVTTVSFSYMNVDCCDQFELLRYIMKNAQVLQLLTIGINHIYGKEQCNYLVKKISLMPKGSHTCQVVFT